MSELDDLTIATSVKADPDGSVLRIGIGIVSEGHAFRGITQKEKKEAEKIARHAGYAIAQAVVAQLGAKKADQRAWSGVVRRFHETGKENEGA